MYIRKKKNKGVSVRQSGQIKSLHSFSFYNYYDENHVGYGDILSFNQDVFSPYTHSVFFTIKGHDVFIFVREGRLTLNVKVQKKTCL